MTPALRKDIIEWDVLNWAQVLEFWQPLIDKLPKEAKILAIGERNGGLSLWLALQGFHVLCTDRIMPSGQAEEMHAGYGVADKISYAVLDIMNPDLPAAHFDIIIMKSVLGGLKADYHDANTRNAATQQLAIQNIYRLLKSGGYLLSADNMQGNVLVKQFRSFGGKNRGWHYFSNHELKQLTQLFSHSTIYAFGILPTLFPSGAFNRIAFFINKYLLQWLPPNTKYIGITAARK